MTIKDQVSNIMTAEVITIEVDNTLDKARELFKKNKIRHLPVTEKDKIIGILSQTDLLRLSFGNTYVEDEMGGEEGIMEELSINQIMKHKPDTVQLGDTIESVAQKFVEAEYHALPVEENGKIRGIVTTTDVIRFLITVAK